MNPRQARVLLQGSGHSLSRFAQEIPTSGTWYRTSKLLAKFDESSKAGAGEHCRVLHRPGGLFLDLSSTSVRISTWDAGFGGVSN